MSGAFFPEVGERHRIPDFWRVPAGWRKYRAIDYGLDMLACLWIAVDCGGRSYVYREVQQPGLIVSEAAGLLRELTLPEERIEATIAPPDLWNRQKDSGRSMAELFAENGVGLLRASSSRVQGWMALKEALKPMRGPGDRPGLLICESCKGLYENLRSIQHDARLPSDCAVEPHDITHICDAARYFAVTRLLGAERPASEEAFGLDAGADYDAVMTGGDVDGGYLSYG